ncbi:MAG: membrane protein insertion efficiency factor YidD [Desulfobacterales bacterium]
MKFFNILPIVVIVSGLTAGTAFADWADLLPVENPAKLEETAEEASIAALPIRLYQKHLSPVLGGRCPMHPSCSHYGIQAIERHGPIMGWFMACDRLIRCGRDEVKRGSKVYINGVPHTSDTVTENDFWRN